MEDTMISKEHRYSPATKPFITMNQESQTISKIKPKIRIIHIFAPEVIKTDVANFRELVQSLTGKPTQKKTRKESHKRLRFSPKVSEKIKEEGEIWVGANSSGGFLGGFGDLDIDGFMHEFTHHNHGSHQFYRILILRLSTLVDSHLGFSFRARSPNFPTNR